MTAVWALGPSAFRDPGASEDRVDWRILSSEGQRAEVGRVGMATQKCPAITLSSRLKEGFVVSSEDQVPPPALLSWQLLAQKQLRSAVIFTSGVTMLNLNI